MASAGAVLSVVGFAMMAAAINYTSSGLLLAALAVVVAGVSLIQPNVNSLLSRRSDPTKQGVILGIGQSVNSLARIVGSAIGIPLLKLDLSIPYYIDAGLMALVLVLMVAASRRGGDFPDDRGTVDQ